MTRKRNKQLKEAVERLNKIAESHYIKRRGYDGILNWCWTKPPLRFFFFLFQSLKQVKSNYKKSQANLNNAKAFSYSGGK